MAERFSSAFAGTEAASELYTRRRGRHDRGAPRERTIDVRMAGKILGALGMSLAVLSLLPPGAAGSHRAGELDRVRQLALLLPAVALIIGIVLAPSEFGARSR